MKNNKILFPVFLVALFTCLFSCNTDLLSPVPPTAFSDKVVFDTPARIELQANGLYAFVKSGNFYGGRYIVYGDIRANDFLNATSNGVTGFGVWNHTLQETSINDVNNLWIAAYAAINQINLFIKGMEDNTGKFVAPAFPAVFATVTAPAYIGEARLLRALTYYSLLQLYARPFADGNGTKPGLPLRLLAETNSLNNDLARSTVAEIYAQILSDLNSAEVSLPLTRTNAAENITKAHRNTAIALKTRVHLSMGNYPALITDANKIVPQNVAPFSATSGAPNALAATIGAVFSAPQQSVESIFSLPFTAQNTPGGQNQLGFYFTGEYSMNTGAGSIVADAANWPATDARRAWLTPLPATTRFLRGKYPSGTPFLDNAPVIRYSEVLLNLSEAIARTTAGVDAKALALLNAVRRRSDASVTLAPATNDDLIAAILIERRIEFLGEGLRNNDIMRLLLPIPAKASIPAVNPTDANYIWPIPFSEIAGNALIGRN